MKTSNFLKTRTNSLYHLYHQSNNIYKSDGTETLLFRDTAPVSHATARFMRLKVSQTN